MRSGITLSRRLRRPPKTINHYPAPYSCASVTLGAQLFYNSYNEGQFDQCIETRHTKFNDEVIMKELPPEPREPDLDECCGGSCCPCVWDVYYDKLYEWRDAKEAIEAQNAKEKEQD